MNTYLYYSLFSGFCSFLLTAIVMPLVLVICKKRNIYDRPDVRKVHKNLTPRLGGLLFVPATAFGTLFSVVCMTGNEEMLLQFRVASLTMAFGTVIIYLVGIIDDLVGMQANYKFLIQTLTASFFPLSGIWINDLYGFCGVHALPFWVGAPITVFLALLVVNALNLIDGIDGLSSSLAIVMLTALAYVFGLDGRSAVFPLFACGLAGSLFAFFLFNKFGNNRRGTKIFMGDAGSLFLGYAISYLCIKYAMADAEAPVNLFSRNGLLVSYTLLIVPVFDLARVAFGRLFKGRPIFSPDKTHIHHLLMARGLSMTGAWLVILALQLLFIALNYAFLRLGVGPTPVFLADVVLFVAFFGLLYTCPPKD